MSPQKYRLGCDIGGTFTDFVLLNDETGDIHVHKCLTTPGDPSQALETGVTGLSQQAPHFVPHLDEVIHGTTLVINAIIERKGARTALITTKGFRDILELAREIRYAPYDAMACFPEPLVPRSRRWEVDERIAADGRIVHELDERQARQVLDSILQQGVRSIAISLINSFENPVHELRLKNLARELAPDIPVSISYEVLPQIREYERTSTTVTNAYVKPLTESYLARLSRRLSLLGFKGKLFIMLSSGGVTSVETAKQFPVRIIESGPTAAVIAGQYYGKLFGIKDLFCFDMGGTTAKSCLIQDGVAEVVPSFEVGRVQRFLKGSGLTIQVPVLDLMEIGAGGGSVAHMSRLGTLRVGPESSGALPGPACYGQGGKLPTVTDADLLLGYLNEDYFLGGRMPLDPAAAKDAILNMVARPLGISLLRATWGIHDLVNETMAAAARTHIAEKGGDPGLVTVLAFGGAGPVHAFGLTRKLGARRLLVPPRAGVGSALGFFTAPRAFDLVRSHMVALNAADLHHLENMLMRMEEESSSALGGSDSHVEFSRSVDARFLGQGAETNVLLPSIPLFKLGKERIRALFDETYKKLYGRTYPDSPIEFVSFRVRASLPLRLLELPRQPLGGTDATSALKSKRLAYCQIEGSMVHHDVYDRYRLLAGMSFSGPAIVEERESTIIVGHGASARVDELGFLWIDL